MIDRDNINWDNVHFYIRGEYFEYPFCCIEEFVELDKLPYPEREKLRSNWKNHVALGTGFIPCRKCMEETIKFDKKQFEKWLGKRLFDIPAIPYRFTVNDPRYMEIEEKYVDIILDKEEGYVS